VLIPVAMLIVLLAVQACIWAHAATLVQNAAEEGDQVATEAGGSASAGVTEAENQLAVTAAQIVNDPSVQVTRMSGDTIRVEVTGNAVSIIPGLEFRVSAVRVGSIQEFRESG